VEENYCCGILLPKKKNFGHPTEERVRQLRKGGKHKKRCEAPRFKGKKAAKKNDVATL